MVCSLYDAAKKTFKTKKHMFEDSVKLQSANDLTTAVEVANRLLGHRNSATLIRNSSESSEKMKPSDFIFGGR